VSGARRVRWGVATAALMTSVALAPGAADAAHASHHAGPSAAAVAQSNAAVARREHQVTAAAAALGRAQEQLRALNVKAEVAFEAYDGAKVKLRAARAAAAKAQAVLDGANRQVSHGQARLSRFVTLAYETGGLSSFDTYLQPGGPSKLVSRVGALNAISDSEHITVQKLTAAKVYQQVVSRQDAALAAEAASAEAVAAHAKTVALTDVNRQRQLLASLNARKSHLNALLGQARSRASRLTRERLQALARQRARAAARAAAAAAAATNHSSNPGAGSPYANSNGNTSGTVSASTALAALHQAESQIGKPYVWGAAGPNSYDCSGLVMWAYAQVGVHLDHWTGDQWNEGAHVSRANLRPGDLVFFAYNTSDPSSIHHVGLYVGNGEMVNAPYTGVDVRYDSAFRSDYIGAVRPYQQ
jgi:cell wall-associated NlpC family hydrolase